MEIFGNILLLILGFAALILGANFFVNGATEIARRLKVPTIIIGLTIVAIGTSLPELAVSVVSAIKGSGDIAVGNVVGSNLANMLLILGIVAAIKSVPINRQTQKFDLPFLMIIHVLFLFFCLDKFVDGSDKNIISRVEGVVFLALTIYYMIVQIRSVKKEKTIEDVELSQIEQEEKPKKELKVWQIVLYLILGLAGIVGGGELVSNSAKFLAIKAGMSDALAGVTIVALGTSLPELVTSIVAAKKGEVDLAIGNVIGSNIMNVLLILGAVATISQINITMTMLIDIIILSSTTILFAIVCYTKKKVHRFEGWLLIVMYFAYMAYAIVRNYAA